jgi:hypothetical protein
MIEMCAFKMDGKKNGRIGMDGMDGIPFTQAELGMGFGRGL